MGVIAGLSLVTMDGLLRLRSPGRIQSFCSQLFHLKDTLALPVVQGPLTCRKKSSQKYFFFLSIQAYETNRTVVDSHGTAHVEHYFSKSQLLRSKQQQRDLKAVFMKGGNHY